MLLLAVACARLLVFSVACDDCGSRFSRASRSLDSQVSIFGVFFEALDFSKNDTPSTRKPCFFEVRGVPKWSQNGSQNASKIKLRCGGPPGGPRGAIWGGFWRAQEAPQGLPRAPRERQERHRRVKMSPRRPKRTLRSPKLTPRRAKMSPRRAKVSSGRLPGMFWGGFPTHF